MQFGAQQLRRNLRQTVTGSGVCPEIAFPSALAARALQVVITAAVTSESGGRQRSSASWAKLIKQVGGGGVFHGLFCISFCLFVSLSLRLFVSLTLRLFVSLTLRLFVSPSLRLSASSSLRLFVSSSL